MAPDLSPDAWAQIRYDYEWTDRPIPDICAEHGISSGTLRDRMRRWNWTRRRQPIPAEGPPPSAPLQAVTPRPVAPAFAAGPMGAPSVAFPGEPASAPGFDPPCAEGPETARDDAAGAHDTGAPSPAAAPSPAPANVAAAPPEDPATIVPRLQQAVARVLPAIEASLARLGAGPAHSRELERTARALGTLTRTLRELNTLLDAHQSRAPAGRICDCDDIPEDIDEFRRNLAYRIDAFVRSRTGGDEAPTPQDT